MSIFKKGDKAYHKIRGVVTITEDERQDKYFIGCDFTSNGVLITGCQLAKSALEKISEAYENWLDPNIMKDELMLNFEKLNKRKKYSRLNSDLLNGIQS